MSSHNKDPFPCTAPEIHKFRTLKSMVRQDSCAVLVREAIRTFGDGEHTPQEPKTRRQQNCLLFAGHKSRKLTQQTKKVLLASMNIAIREARAHTLMSASLS